MLQTWPAVRLQPIERLPGLRPPAALWPQLRQRDDPTRATSHRRAFIRQCCRGQAADSQNNIVAYNPHPDAVRRRSEVQHRKQQRESELQEWRAAGLQWWAHQAPANMRTVCSREEYDRALLQCKAAYGLVVVDFFAPWCAGCRRLYPKLRQIAAANLDVAFIKVNTDAEKMMHLSQELGVTGLPYFLLFSSSPSIPVQAFAANLSKIGRLRTEISALKAALAKQAGAVLQGAVAP